MAGNPYLAPNDTTGVPTATAATQTSAGVGSAGVVIAANSSGVLDTTFLPPGIGPGVQVVPSSENLAAGDFVNIYSNAGVATARKADASVATKPALGFVIAAVTSPANATVYALGEPNTAQTGLTVGDQWLSETTPGKTQTTPTSTSGHRKQYLGFATSATSIDTVLEQGYTR